MIFGPYIIFTINVYTGFQKNYFINSKNKIGVYYLILNNSNYSICLVQKLKSTLWRIGTNEKLLPIPHIFYTNTSHSVKTHSRLYVYY